MAGQQIIFVPELIGPIAEYLAPRELCCLRAASSTAEVNTRSIFAQKCFSKKCVAYTERGLRRLLDIARSERLSGALKTIEFFHVNPAFEYSRSKLEALLHTTLLHLTSCTNRRFCRGHGLDLVCVGATSATDETWLNAVRGFFLYVGFLREQQAWWHSGVDVGLLTSIFRELGKTGTRYRISIIGIDYQYLRACRRPETCSHRTLFSGFDVDRVQACLYYGIFLPHQELGPHHATFNRVLSTLLRTVSMLKLKIESLVAPLCSLTDEFANSLKDLASVLPQSLGSLTDLDIGYARSVYATHGNVDESYLWSSSKLNTLRISRPPGKIEGPLRFGWRKVRHRSDRGPAAWKFLPPNLKELQLQRVSVSRSDISQFILNHAATLENVTLSRVQIFFQQQNRICEILKQCSRLTTLRITLDPPPMRVFFLNCRYAFMRLQDHPDVPTCLGRETYCGDTVCVVRSPLLLPFLDELERTPFSSTHSIPHPTMVQ